MPWPPEEEAGEEFIGPGSGHDSKDPEDGAPGGHGGFGALRHVARSCCHDNHHRRLSMASVVCGVSCIGAVALKYSVQSEERQRLDPERAAVCKRKAKKFSIISIVVFFSIIAAIPVLLALVSYLATLQD